MPKKPWDVPEIKPDQKSDQKDTPVKIWATKHTDNASNHLQNQRAYTSKQPNNNNWLKRFFTIVFIISAALLAISYMWPGDIPYFMRFVKPVLWLALLLSIPSLFSRIFSREGLRNISIWGVIGLTIAGMYQFINLDNFQPQNPREIQRADGLQQMHPDGYMVVERNYDGHFWLESRVNNIEIDFLVDTGATNVVLSPRDAKRLGINIEELDYTLVAKTANGEVQFAEYILSEMIVGPRKFYNVPVTVNRSEMPGSLLGLTLLNQFSKIEFQGNHMVIEP